VLDLRARLRACALVIGALAGSAAAAAAAAAERRTVTFVMGEDSAPGSAFFAAGERYYQERRTGEDLLVTRARSWSEIREWLARSKARGSQPWGNIVVVAHGSQWTGASVPVFQGEKELRASELDLLIASGVFPPLGEEVLDERSLLRVESCGVGRRPDLLSRYVQLLTGRANGIRVEASEQLVEFGYSYSPANQSWRRERTYSVRVRPGRSLSAAEMQRLAAEGGRVIPAEMMLGLSNAECAIPLRRLVGLSTVQTTLSDFGMRAAELEWSIRRRPDRTCTLSGHAQVISSAPQQISGIGSR
jgi:hypothetical protein